MTSIKHNGRYIGWVDECGTVIATHINWQPDGRYVTQQDAREALVTAWEKAHA